MFRTFSQLIILMTALSLLSSCLGKQQDQPASSAAFSPLTIYPSAASVPVGRTITFQGQAGIPPYHYQMDSGNGQIDPLTGVYSAPTTTGVEIVEVIDSEKSHKIAVIAITPQFIISPANLQLTVTAGSGFTASGGTAPYTYSIVSSNGSTVTFDPVHNAYIGVSGKIDKTSGLFTATAPGSDVVEVRDSNGLTERAVATVFAKPLISPTFPAVPLDGRQLFTTAGGTPPLTYSIVAGGACPVPGSDCYINPTTGAFRGPLTSGSVIVRVTDSLTFYNQTTVQVYHPSVIANGDKHSCYLDVASGRIRCWGDNTSAQIAVNFPTSSNRVTTSTTPVDFGLDNGGGTLKALELAAGARHNCAIVNHDLNGTYHVLCWGDNSKNQCGIGGAAGTYTIWGDNPLELKNWAYASYNGTGSVVNIQSGGYTGNPVALSLGQSHSCVLLNNPIISKRNVHCWGDNTYGQAGRAIGASYARVGDAGGEMGALPDLMPASTNTKLVVSGWNHVCALTMDGYVYCWGKNDKGQVGIGTTSIGVYTPTLVNLGAGVLATSIAAGGDHTCVILGDNTVKCWGDNSQGELGLNVSSSVAAFYSDASSALTNVTTINDSNPVTPTTTLVDLVITGGHQTCVQFSADKGLRCWGLGANGQLGNGAAVNVGNDPATNIVSNVLAAIQIGTSRVPVIGSSYSDHICVITDDARAKCWGRNDQGQLGIGDAIDRGSVVNQMGDNLPFLDL
jgi:alpha-tubulin suppressor-like RCC1 family protein